MRRTLIAVAVLLLGLLLGFGVAPALADDLPPPVFPSGLPGPDDVPGGGTVENTPGPTYVVDPASPGTALPPPRRAAKQPAKPVGKAQVDDARRALDRVRSKPGSRVAGPVATTAAPVDDGTDWWLIGSGAFLGLLLIEARRVTGGLARRP
jgi:hypothetical protein